MDERHSKLLEITTQSSEKSWESITRRCQDYAECCGLLLRRQDSTGRCWTEMGSMTLLPTKYPLSAYNQALEVQQTCNELYHKVASDHQFLKEALAGSVESDEFVRKLWQLYERVRQEGYGNTISLDILRSDYMYQIQDGCFKLAQIEVNTVASSMAVLSNKVNQTHKYLGRVLNDGKLIDANKFPQNDSVSLMAEGLVKAWQLYDNPSAVVLVVISGDELNFADIRNIEYEMLNQNSQVKVIIKSTQDLIGSTTLTEDRLLLVNKMEIAVIYLRVFYSPNHYQEDHWDLRLLMERSKAIKCPSIHSQLAGSKSVQQALTMPLALERYLSADQCTKMRQCFVNIFTLTEESIAAATNNPQHFVLKPNREGGGNNYYGDDITRKLKEIQASGEEESFILMERVYPPSQYNCRVVGPNSGTCCTCVPIVSELGIYGAVIGTSTKLLHNTSGGYLLRSKSTDSSEGGFYTGHSSLDTPYLLEDSEMLEELRESSTTRLSSCCC